MNDSDILLNGIFDLFPAITRQEFEAISGDGHARQVCFAEHHAREPKRSDNSNYAGTFNLPFFETVGRLFNRETGLELFENKNRPGYWRSIRTEEEFQTIDQWARNQGRRYFLRDCLDLSIALDTNLTGPETGEYTVLGQWEHDAKQEQDALAIDGLSTALISAIISLPDYRDADLICGTPAHPDKEFDLPRRLAQDVASALELENITGDFNFRAPKQSIKELSLADKWAAWEATGLELSSILEDRPSIILIDDKYQSGATLQFVASKLREAGAGEIYGLCAVKTLRNSDNQ